MSGGTAIKDPSGGGDGWMTPFPEWEEIRERYFRPYGLYGGVHGEILDPCPNLDRILPGTEIFQNPNGLSYRWDKPFFCNPPWSDIGPWAIQAARASAYGVMLLPARTDQAWYQRVAPLARTVHIGGRINYINPATGTTQVIDKVSGKLKNGAISCPSMLLIFGTGHGVDCWTPDCHEATKSKVEAMSI